MTTTAPKNNNNNLENPLWKDLVIISRPGWWLVSAWLYLAPISHIHNYTRFAVGLLYVCLPLNLLTYGLNDLTDIDLDLENERKGNFVFGSRGLSKQRLKLVLKIAMASTIVPLPFLCNDAVDFIFFFTWYALAWLVNLAYNCSFLGKLSGQGPWETPLVYVGFGLVTAFSYWTNHVESENDNDDDLWKTVWGISTEKDSFHLFGCNRYYWIHLALLISTTQAWTEYMDYEVDRNHNRQTTLVRLGSKRNARLAVMTVLLANTSWVYSVYRRNPEWNTVFGFAVVSAIMFCGTEIVQETTASSNGDKYVSASTSSFSSSLWIVAIGQNVGGLLLLYDIWSKGLFVR